MGLQGRASPALSAVTGGGVDQRRGEEEAVILMLSR